jgi:hypothetical protein
MNLLEKQRLTLKDSLMDLTEKRLIKDIDRRQFSEDVMNHRRKVNILDVNINKCKDLIKRLDSTSFGVLGKETLISVIKTTSSESLDKLINKGFTQKQKTYSDDEITDTYKDKYYDLKKQFDQLEDEYQELKDAVEKLIQNR